MLQFVLLLNVFITVIEATAEVPPIPPRSREVYRGERDREREHMCV